MSGQTLLDTPLQAFFSDRPTLHRVVMALASDQGVTYLEALEALHEGSDSARADRLGPKTLGGALEHSRSKPEDIADGVKLLERRDAAVDAAFERAAGPKLLDEAVAAGLVMLDGPGAPSTPFRESLRGAPLSGDVGSALADPVEFERRLSRMRTLQPGYGGDSGREQFRRDDRLHLEAGRDFVRTAELERDVATAHAQAQQVGRQLDAVIAAAGDKRQRLRMLDAQIAQLEGKREQAQVQAIEASAERLYLLDQADGKEPAAVSTVKTMAVHGDELRQQVNDRLKLLGRNEGEFLKTLEEVLAGARGVEPAHEPETPEGVHPGSHQVDQRVRERMRQLDRPESEYITTLTELMAEGSG